MKIDSKFIVKVAGTLTAICLVVAALLGGVDAVTRDRIDAINLRNTEEALASVLPNCTFEKVELTSELTAAAGGAGAELTEAYKALSGGEPVGYAFKVVASGSQGNIEMIVGVDADNAVTGVSIVSNKETKGIGSKVMGNEPTKAGKPVLDQFIGKTYTEAGLTVGKDGLDAISGATVSTKGVTKGVNGALAVAEALV